MWRDWPNIQPYGHTGKFLLLWAALFVWVGSLVALKLVFNAGNVVLTVAAVVVGVAVLYAVRTLFVHALTDEKQLK
ncbi:hypothetical protein [Haladaptatus sp. ZSTT2]|uniref:hypothetical protein n=1 Tax=Haladaptatus sp. ZSTT2 TaxID=3120515 RepID=UPI00300EB6A8